MRRSIGAAAFLLVAALGALPAAAQTDPFGILSPPFGDPADVDPLSPPDTNPFGISSGFEVPLPPSFLGAVAEPLQARAAKTSSKPLFDFKASQMNVGAGAVLWSGDFEADPDFAALASIRVPMPALPTERFGVFAQLFAGHLARDLEDYYEDTDGMYFGGVLGADCSFLDSKGSSSLKGSNWMLLAQLGLAYVHFNDITGTDNGFGLMMGLEGGVNVGYDPRNPTWITVSPQFYYDTEDYFLILSAGVAFGF